jgi:hypothetical protein
MAFNWKQPTKAQMQRADPTGQATAQLFSTQAAKSPKNNPNRGSSPSTAVKSPQTVGSTGGPGTYGTPFIHGSNAWYGGLNDIGKQIASGSPAGFWQNYQSEVMGMDPSSGVGMMVASKYNPMALGNLFYNSPSKFGGDEQRLAGASAISGALTGSRAGFINPSAIIGQTLQALATMNPNQIMRMAPEMQGLANQMATDPIGQVDTLLGFLQDVLSAAMPPQAVEGLMSTLQRLGIQFQQSLSKGSLQGASKKNFAQFLIQNLGPTLGF